jgi:hypothetical protein
MIQSGADATRQLLPQLHALDKWQSDKIVNLLDNPDLQHLAHLKHRTFLSVEVNIIYQHLG